MDLTEVANRLNECYGCELITDEDDKNLSSLNDEDMVSINQIQLPTRTSVFG